MAGGTLPCSPGKEQAPAFAANTWAKARAELKLYGPPTSRTPLI